MKFPVAIFSGNGGPKSATNLANISPHFWNVSSEKFCQNFPLWDCRHKKLGVASVVLV